jgi:endogenous inhibitor of DNA gyrase (YacG/DUF329 family)
MSSSSPNAKPPACPICGKNTADAYRPFCSKRCADVDLARWFTGSYAIGGREEDEGDNATPPEHRKPFDDEDDEA